MVSIIDNSFTCIFCQCVSFFVVGVEMHIHSKAYLLDLPAIDCVNEGKRVGARGKIEVVTIKLDKDHNAND